QMCTVYIAESGADALKEGFTLGDIFAGFQYAVVHNYLNRVMGQRTLGEKIFFQGKPATNPSLAWTLAEVTNRQIIIPPNPGAMGAWGIGLCAIDEIGRDRLQASPSLDLNDFLAAEIIERSEFTCKDKRCQTMCPIERTTIQFDGVKKVATSGGACPKYEIAAQNSNQTSNKLPMEAPNPFAQREELLIRYEKEIKGRPTVAIPMTGPVGGYLPFLATIVSELGFSVNILKSDAKSLARGEHLCNSFDSCGPVKIAHDICDTDVPYLFFPKIIDFDDRSGPGGQACVTEQAMPEIVEQSLKAQGRDVAVIRPKLYLAKGLQHPETIKSLMSLAVAIGADPAAIEPAVNKAAKEQMVYETALEEIGSKALDYAASINVPTVVICGSQHVIHDSAANSKIPDILRQNGAMAIPMDCFQISSDVPEMKKIYWGDANRYMRAAVCARNMRT
ncbi:MAG: hypothetical protein GY850_04515, partial [bacterium]|nr:hypothetical protein [bacterium]